MRVCIVTVASYAHGIGGMQAHGLDLSRGLVRAGHEVDVIAPRHPEGLAETQHDGIRWHFVDAPSRRPGLPMRHPAWLRLSAEAFGRLHAEDPFDVVHSESTSGLGLLRRHVHRAVPFAVKFHGNYLGLAKAALRRAISTTGYQSWIQEAKLLAWISGQHFIPIDAVYRFRVCEAMVPSYQQLAGTQLSSLIKRSRLHVVPNGVDTDMFRPRERGEARAELGLDSGAPLLAAVGRLNREKGFDIALRAFARVGRDTRLVIVGGGEEQQALLTLARRLGVADRVRFTGMERPERVPLYMAAADVFLFPTQRDEAAPLVLPQAMACARPVVASSVGGVTEVIDQPGRNGVLVPPGIADALAEATNQLLADEHLRGEIGSAARGRIVREYSLGRMVERTLDVYRIAAGRLGQAI